MSAGRELARLRWATPRPLPEGDSFGARLKRARLGKGLTLEQLAERVGASSKGQISRYESDRTLPRGRMLANLIAELGEEFLDEER